LALLLKVLLRDRPGIVHFFLPEAYIIGGLAALLSGRRRLVMSRRSLNNYQARYFLGVWIERQLHKRMKVVVGNSLAVVKQLRAESGASERLGLIYNGIDLAPFKGTSRDRSTLSEPGLGSETLVLTLVANLIKYKGHLDLLKALARIRDDLPAPWVLLLVGRDTGIGASLQTAARELGLAPHIHWLGERNDVAALFQATDIGILCSHEEGFSNALLEGMAAGIPMIATNVGGNIEAVIDGGTGLLVPAKDAAALGDAILRLAHDPPLRRTLGAAGKKRVEQNYSLGACVAEYERLYEALAADSENRLAQFITSSGEIR
jgi:glycosyltransferase involved in cell wall biosynthesis